ALIDSLLDLARVAAAAIRARVPAVVDLALAAVEVAAVVFVMNKEGTFQRHHLLAEARRHLALVLRGRLRPPGLDERIVDVAITVHCADITDSRTLRARTRAHRLYTARWTEADLQPVRRPRAVADPDPYSAPDADTDALAVPRLPDGAAGEWEIPRVPLLYDRAVLAAGVVRAKLATTVTAAGRGRDYDVAAHQQAAMPEQLLPPPPAASPARDDDDQEQEAEPQEAVDFTELRALRKSRTDTESLGLTAEQLRHLQEKYQQAGEESRVRAAPYIADQDDAGRRRPVRVDDQQAHRPQQPASGPHRGPGAGH
ncbi:hypothetical protein, partial [Streptomyces tsukubensis]|uniref:hypothetical protein n=1 Tax=Streptomyces tsukubensis TaxID=83656 RepID=UPI00344E4E7A